MVNAWHALVGYWGGALTRAQAIKKYDPRMEYPVHSPGNRTHVICDTLENVEQYGVGLIDPSKIRSFYDDFHSYLASCGVDGVKVDVQDILEMLGAGYGGRVALTRQYQEALEESVVKNFRANNLINFLHESKHRVYLQVSSTLSLFVYFYFFVKEMPKLHI